MRCSPRTFGMVLAAGAGTRMGTPKSRLMLEDRSLLAHHVERLFDARCAAVVTVVRPEESRTAPGGNATLVVSVRTRSQAESLALGLSELVRVHEPRAQDVIVITPVDVLPALPSTLDELIAAHRRRDIDAVTPRHRGWSGHPVLVKFGILAEYVDPRLPPRPLQDIVRSARRARIDVEDDAVLSDLDTPDDLADASRGRDLWIGRPSS